MQCSPSRRSCMCSYCRQACRELKQKGLANGCILPEDYIVVVFRYGMARELLWRVSWALNVIGHNVVDLPSLIDVFYTALNLAFPQRHLQFFRCATKCFPCLCLLTLSIKQPCLSHQKLLFFPSGTVPSGGALTPIVVDLKALGLPSPARSTSSSVSTSKSAISPSSWPSLFPASFPSNYVSFYFLKHTEVIVKRAETLF